MKSYIHTSSCTYWQSSCLFPFKLYLWWKYSLYTYMYISIRASIFTVCIQEETQHLSPRLSKTVQNHGHTMSYVCYRCISQPNLYHMAIQWPPIPQYTLFQHEWLLLTIILQIIYSIFTMICWFHTFLLFGELVDCRMQLKMCEYRLSSSYDTPEIIP